MITQKNHLPTHRVSLVIDRFAGMSAMILEGISSFMRTRRSWIVQRKDVKIEEMGMVRAFEPDGIIAMIWAPGLKEELRKIETPLVDVWGLKQESTLPCVAADFRAVGRLQAGHLISRGHRRLICVGHFCRDHMHSLWSGAREECGEADVELDRLDLASIWERHKVSVEVDRALGVLLSKMPLPLAILTESAEDAERISQRCHEHGLDIPEKVAIITVNDDAISNTLANPAFTTVDLPWSRIGFLAAQRLDQLLRGERLQEQRTFIAPTGITGRRSTESLALPDPQLARAVAFIREHAGEKILVKDVAKTAGMSRRLLEDRFRSCIGHTPFREIRHHQVQRVRELLLETDLTLEEICDHSAFAYLSHLTKAFREEYGMPPGAYRRQTRP